MGTVMPGIFGNAGIKALLGNTARDDKIPHSVILDGPAGSGRHTLARAFAAAAICTNRHNASFSLPCGECANCKKVFAGIHPDVMYFGLPNDRKTVSVDIARTIRSAIYITPNEADYKVIIMEDAECMTAEAQNALLLSVEDPPPFVKFIFITQGISKILPTLRSRSITFKADTLCPADIEAILLELPKGKSLKKSDPEKFYSIVKMSGGVAGQAQKLIKSSALSRYGDTAALVVSALIGESNTEKIKVLTSLPKEREKLTDIFLSAEKILRDLIMISVGAPASLVFFQSRDDAQPFLKKAKISKLYDILKALQNSRAGLEANEYHVLVKEKLFIIGT